MTKSAADFPVGSKVWVIDRNLEMHCDIVQVEEYSMAMERSPLLHYRRRHTSGLTIDPANTFSTELDGSDLLGSEQ